MNGLVGQTLGGYRVVNQIGKGGMATVYKAYQPSLDRYVAIKVLPPYYAEQDDSFSKRFEREARSVAKLRHPNILMVHDYGEHNSVTYIIMEYVDAGTLKDHLASKPSLQQTVSLIGQVASALDYAHDQGVIHRDIKPSNILLPEPDWALLTDFGLATMVGGSLLTQSGMTVGTPAYMSPEQGRGEKVDKATDIYSLGVILYEMVTGAVPFTAETPMAVVVKHIIEPLPLPRTKVSNIPESLERIILKSMAKEPADRYQQAGELADALNDVVGTLESPFYPQSAPNIVTIPKFETPERVQSIQEFHDAPTKQADTPAEKSPKPAAVKRPRSKKWPLIATLGGLLVVAAVAITLLLLGVISIGDRVNVFGEPEATRTFEQLWADANAYIESGDYAAAIREYELALEQDPNNSDIYLDIANVYMMAGEFEEAEDTIQKTIASSPNDPWLRDMAGWMYHDMENYQEAIAQFEKAIEINGMSDSVLQGLASSYQALGEPEKAMEIIEGAISSGNENDLALYDNLGWQYLDQGNYEKAEEYFRKAIELDPANSGTWFNLAEVYRWRGDLDGAIEIMKEAVEAHPESAELYEGLGRMYYEIDDLDSAIEAFEEAIALDPTYTMAYSGLADVYFQIGQEEQAYALLEEAIEDYPDQPDLYESLGLLYQNTGNDREAIPYFETAIELEPYYGWTYLYLAAAYRRTGNTNAIYDLLDEAIENNPDDPWLMEAIGQIFVELGDCDAAIEYFNSALELDPNIESARQGLTNCGE